MYKASIIIPAFNQHELTKDCINRVLSTCTGVEIILVDNGSDPPFSNTIWDTSGTKSSVKHIRMEWNCGFGAASNAGMRYATGENIVLLNNDTQPESGWLEGLLDALAMAQSGYAQICNIGLVGPVSNAVGGRQKSPVIADASPGATGFLSGFCLLISRECYEAVGDLEEWGVGGFEDNDYVLRAALAGFGAVIDFRTHMEHLCSKTISQFPEARGGVGNRDAFAKKWHEEFNYDNPTLVVGYRIQNCGKWLERSLSNTAAFADAICILDDGSIDNTSNIINKFKNLCTIPVHYERYEREFDEERDRRALHQMLLGAECDWIMSLDGDEVVEDAEGMRRLLTPMNPQVIGWNQSVYTFWNQEDIRVDGIFGNLAGMRLARSIPWNPFNYSVGGLHMTHLPPLPVEWIRYVGVPILHYGYENEALRKRKYKTYSTLDKEKVPELVGTVTGEYDHLVSGVVTLAKCLPAPTIAMNILTQIDKIVQTHDLLWELGDTFDEIVIGLTDEPKNPDVDLFPEWSNAKLFRADLSDSFSVARNEIKDHTKSEWIFQLDTDERIDPSLAHEARLMIRNNPDVSAFVVKILNFLPESKQMTTEMPRLFTNAGDVFYSGREHESVGKSIVDAKRMIASLNNIIHHYGYLGGLDATKSKFARYWKSVMKSFNEDPTDGKSWFNLAMHFMNKRLRVEAISILEVALKLGAVDPTRRELMYQHLLRAGELANMLLNDGMSTDDLHTFKCQIISWVTANLLSDAPVFDDGIDLKDFPKLVVRLEMGEGKDANNDQCISESVSEVGHTASDK